MIQDEQVNQLIEQARTLRYDRRQILKRAAALGLSAPAISLLLAACGGDDEGGAEATAPGETGADATPTTAAEGDGETPEAGTTPADAAETPEDGGAEPTDAETGAESTPGTSAPPAGSGGIINLPTTLGDSGIGNPILTGNIQLIRFYVFSRLMVFDDEGTLQPELAQSWEFSDDNLQLTLNLAEATWHDGEQFTADDVIFTFDTIQAEATDTPLRSRLQVGGEYITWEKVDDQTITLTMTEPYAPLLFALNEIPIIPEHILADVADINTAEFNSNPIGTGSFRLAEWVPDQFFRMERFDEHFRGPALADGLSVFFLADSNAGVAAMEAGEIDMVFTPPELQTRFEDSADFTLHNYVYFTSITLAFNHKHPILSDLTVRKAIELGIDKVSLTETVTRGRGIVSHNQFAEGGPLDRYNDYDNVPESVFDPEEANRMLDEAGYALNADGIREKDGQPLSFTCITYSGFDEYTNAQVIIQEMLREIGIDVIPTVVEYTTLEGMWADPNDDPNNRALELEEWPHPFEFDPDLFNEMHSANVPPGDNYMWLENDELDALIEQGRVETDPDARIEIYKQIDVLRSEVLPAIPLYLAVDGWVASNLVLGPDGNHISTPYFRQYVLTAAHTWYKAS